jgi:hypothetical protein
LGGGPTRNRSAACGSDKVFVVNVGCRMPRVDIWAEYELGREVETVKAGALLPHSKVRAARRHLMRARARIVGRWRGRRKK